MAIITTMTIGANTPPAACIHGPVQAIFIALLNIWLLIAMPTVRAAEPDAPTVGELFNWYYATSFGTGVYTVGDSQVSVLALPFSYTLREPDAGHWGVRLTLPVSTALGNFDLYDPDLGQIKDIHLAAWSVLPGAEAEIPLGPHWRVNPFANIGWAKERETGAGAAVYQAGVSTLYALQAIRYPEIEIGGKYIYAGYRSSGDDSTPISLVSLGIATTFPTAWTLANGRQANLGLYWIGTRYLIDLRFRRPRPGYTVIHGEYELGATFGLRPAVKILGVSFDRIGLGYVIAHDDLRGIRLVTEFGF
jgi:hypothetical protein